LRRAALLAAAAFVLTACTGPAQPAPTTPPDVTRTRTVTGTRTPPRPTPSFTPPPARSVAPLSPGAAPARGEIEKRCPYIASTHDQDPTGSLADLEGDRVYRTTVLRTVKPVGCRFYFWAPPYEAIADILPRRFATAAAAHNAMVLTAEAGADAQGKPEFVGGIDGVLYRTKFFGPDGKRDWALVFAAGRTMVVVHTQRNDQQLNALLIGRAIARKF
jgi:hypothetical protein